MGKGPSDRGRKGSIWSLVVSRRELLRAALGVLASPAAAKASELAPGHEDAEGPIMEVGRFFLPAVDRGIPPAVEPPFTSWPVVSLASVPPAEVRLGRALIHPNHSVRVSSWGTFTLTYQVGEAGLPVGARLEVRLPVVSTGVVFWSDVQTTDPLGAGYLTMTCSRPGAKLAVLFTERQRELHRVVVELREAALKKGDTITLVYGDTRYGGQGTHVPEWGAPRPQRFYFLVDAQGSGDYALLRDPPTVQLVAEEAVRLEVNASATARPGEPFRITVRAVDRLGNLVTGYRGEVRFSCNAPHVELPDSYRFTEADQGAHTFTGVATQPGVITIAVRDDRRRRGHSNPIGVGWLPDMHIYFGDLHVHTQLHRHDDLSDGSDLDYVYWYARDVVGLDFAAPTNHDIYLTDEEWRITQRKAAEHNDPGRFVSFLAYEWTSSAASTQGFSAWGHRNVLYLGDEEPLFRCMDPRTKTLDGLYAALADREAIVIPHHPMDQVHPMRWDQHDPHLERLAEIYQVRGPQERWPPRRVDTRTDPPHPLSVQAALARGYRMGLVASTDNHLGQPATPYRRDRRQQYWDRPGITAVLAPELTREALFQALRARRVYGTTLARLLVDFRMDGHFMGEEYETSIPPVAYIRVVGTAPIARVTIVRDNQDIVVFPGGGGRSSSRGRGAEGQDRPLREEAAHRLLFPAVSQSRRDSKVELTWVDPYYLGEHFYYVRVEQEDGEMAWTSPIWVTGRPRKLT